MLTLRTLCFMTCCCVTLALGHAAPCAAGADDPKPITTADLLLIRTVSDLDITADGSRAVFTVRSIETQESNASGKQEQPTYHYRSHLFFLDLLRANPTPRQLTFGERNDSSPKLSPNGRRIAFLRKGEDNGASQVWMIPVDGGEAQQMTEFEHGVSALEWSPQGNRLLVSAPVPFDELDGLPRWPMEAPNKTWEDTLPSDLVTPRPDGTRAEIRAWLAQNASEQSPRVIHRLRFQDEHALAGPMRFTHLFLIDLDSPHSTPQQLTQGFYNHQDATFMPNGQHIVYVASKPAEQHPDRISTTELYIIDADGTNDRLLYAIDNWRVRSPQPSRDGSMIAFLAQHQDEPTYRQWQLGLIESHDATPAVMWLTDEDTFDASVRQFAWRTEQTGIYFNTAREGAFPLMTIHQGLIRPAPVVEDVEGSPIGVHAFATGGGTVLYAATSVANPSQLRMRDGSGDRLIFDLNEWVQNRVLSFPVEHWVSRPDGKRIQYWVMEPTHRERGETYPLLLQIHGGPQAMWGPGEASMWHEFQLFCSWGYGVVYSNPRGSSGYGYQFQRANYQDWGEGPTGDVLAALDQAMLHEWVDRDRLVVTGGSYAGYLTAWIVAHDHRFKAAAAQRGVYHIPTFFGEGNAWRLVPYAMGGTPFDARYRSITERESPFTYVNRIRTPLLIKHADNDLRTGVSQSEMMYRALKYLERPVEFVRYPGEGHDMSRSGNPRFRMDRLNRMIDFFERHIDNPRPAPTHTTAHSELPSDTSTETEQLDE